MKPRPPYAFLAAEGFPPTVYDSQVADFLRVLSRAGVGMDVVNFDPLYPKTLATREGRARKARLRRGLPGRLHVLPYVPYEDRIGAPAAQRLLAATLGEGPWVLHARGLKAGYLAAALRERRSDVALIYDMRGDDWAEHCFHHTGRGRGHAPGLERIQAHEARVCAAATRILCVSQALADTVHARYPAAARKTRVFPCAYDPQKFFRDPEARARWRRELGIGERFCWVYCGSLVPYQLPERLVALGTLLGPDEHLLLLTPHVERARELIAEARVDPARVTVRSARHDEVCGLLNAADAGVLLRADDPVNHAASPTKVAEYLACGLGVLISPGIGDHSARIHARGLGQVLGGLEDVDLRAGMLALRAAPPDPEEVTQAAHALSRESLTPRYVELYAEVLAELRG
ncbi:MAG: glycosyltransferase [Planctomycetota bacterium]